VRLFAERAQVVLPSFHVTDANVAAVAQICIRLDGIPLAIELAAARVPLLRVDQIARRLDDRFRLLTGGSRTAVPRQQTLRTLIDWSYDLLSASEQRMLQRLSVFAGGWSLDAAEAVEGDGDKGDVLNLLTALVEKSLVHVERVPRHETRYRMLETIREYALERLRASGVFDDAQRQHATYVLSWIEANQPYLRGIEQRTWLDKLELEHDNLRAALQWSVSGGDAVLGARLAGKLAQWEHSDVSGFWVARGHIAEGQRWLELALDALGDQQSALQAWTMLHLESLYEHVMTTHSDDLLERIHAWFSALDDQTGIAHVLLRKAGRLWQKGELGEAQQAAEASLQMFQACGDLMGACNARYQLCTIETQNNHLDRARTLIEQCIAFGRTNQNFVGTAGDLVALGGIAERQGNYDEAVRHLHESISLSEQLGEHFQLTWPLHGLGWLALDDVDDGRAFQLLEYHIGEFRNKGLTPFLCVLLPVYGMLIGKRGDLVQARRVLHECATLVETTGHRRFLCNSVEAGAVLAKQGGQPNLAARWLGSESVFVHDPTVQTFNRTHPSIERLLVDTRAALDPDAFEAAWQAGQQLSIEQVIGEILAWTKP
jgi:predicted ATPase